MEGFEVDVGRELGRRLGVEVLVVLPPTMLPVELRTWDVGFRQPDWSIDPLHSWCPRPLRAAAWWSFPQVGADSLDDVNGQPSARSPVTPANDGCWERTRRLRRSASYTAPIPSTLVLRSSDEACFDAVSDVLAVADLTARLSPQRGDLIRGAAI